MKVLFVTNTFENVSNGPSKFASYLLDMNNSSDRTEIKILTEDISAGSRHLDSGQVFRLDLTLNSWTRSWGFVYRMFPYYRACISIRQFFRYDILIFNNAITGIWSALKLDTPVLGMINDDNSLSVSRNHSGKTKTWFRHLLFHILEKLACKVETGIIVNSKYLYDLVAKKYNPGHTKLHILYKGVQVGDKIDIRPIQTGFPVRVLFVKSDYLRGGLYDLHQALGMLTNYQFVLQVIGHSFSEQEKLSFKPHFPHVNITFPGVKSQAEIQQYMLKSDLFIVPSHREALGVGNMEAMANGLTVISTCVGGIPEVLDDGKNGWMAKPGNPMNLAHVILYALEHPAERLQKQKNGFVFVSRHFTISHVLRRFQEILHQYLP